MKIYFYSPQNSIEAQSALTCLKQAGALVNSNLLPKLNVHQETSEGMGKVDGLLVLAKNLDAQAAYLLALVLSQNRPVLCLVPQGAKLDHTLENLRQQPNFAKKLQINFYQSQELKPQIMAWLKSLDQGSLRILFNIKYTLRLSAKISDYLNWKAEQINMSGADWLRQMIQENMDNDKDYQAVLKNKYKV